MHIAESIIEGLCAPWQDAFVVKLLGESIGDNILKVCLTRLWRLATWFDLMDIGNCFFMIKFDTKEDRLKVIQEGPCMMFDHYLTIQLWLPNSTSLLAKIDRTMAWIRFPGLNLLFYDESILLALVVTVQVDQTHWILGEGGLLGCV